MELAIGPEEGISYLTDKGSNVSPTVGYDEFTSEQIFKFAVSFCGNWTSIVKEAYYFFLAEYVDLRKETE